MNNIKIIKFRVNRDNYGNLVPIENSVDIPFAIKRIYYIFDVKHNIRRGFHAHKKLTQVLICVRGSVNILVKTPLEEKTILLNNPEKGLLIGPMIWREMFDFSNDAVLVVLASDFYKPSDYIRDYEKYKKIFKAKL